MNEQKKKNANIPASPKAAKKPVPKGQPVNRTGKKEYGYKNVNARANITAALNKQEFLGALKALVTTINKTNGQPNNAALVIYQPLVTKVLKVFFDNFHTKYKVISGDDYGTLYENWKMLCKFVDEPSLLSEAKRKKFHDEANTWTLEMNRYANLQKHELGAKFTYDYQTHIIKPYNVLLETLDNLLEEKNLFTRYTLSGDPKSGIWYGDQPPLYLKANSFEIRTAPDDNEPAFLLYFDIDKKSGFFEREMKRNLRGVSIKQSVFSVRYQLDYKSFAFKNVEQGLVTEVVGVYCRVDRNHPKNDVLMPPYTGNNSQHNPGGNVWEVKVGEKDSRDKNKYYVKLRVTYKDKRLKGKKIQQEFGVTWNGQRIDDVK